MYVDASRLEDVEQFNIRSMRPLRATHGLVVAVHIKNDSG
jgi:hypothetical protein